MRSDDAWNSPARCSACILCSFSWRPDCCYPTRHFFPWTYACPSLLRIRHCQVPWDLTSEILFDVYIRWNPLAWLAPGPEIKGLSRGPFRWYDGRSKDGFHLQICTARVLLTNYHNKFLDLFAWIGLADTQDHVATPWRCRFKKPLALRSTKSMKVFLLTVTIASPQTRPRLRYCRASVRVQGRRPRGPMPITSPTSPRGRMPKHAILGIFKEMNRPAAIALVANTLFHAFCVFALFRGDTSQSLWGLREDRVSWFSS